MIKFSHEGPQTGDIAGHLPCPVGVANPARSSDKFAVQDGLLFNALREGDKVMFISQKIDGVNTITKLQKE
jgi:hypothetical protein